MAKPVRRLITGHDANGKAICLEDDVARNVLKNPDRRGYALTNLWATDATPATFSGDFEDPVAGPVVLHPPQNGTVLRIIEFGPEDPEQIKALDGRSAFARMGAADAVIENARHPLMHRTDSVDYAIILEGEITMLLDETEYLLKAGDVVVQRGTNHAWSNQSKHPCRIAFVLIDGK
ncbi:MAG: cupin domain-containing protein [Pseudomonadales bacterium]|jgi:mannose-6-phosphate isomerase-like protein (cupin superfamily)|nr:cupin domain-containing protein [Pseudomonadales bacterium]MDP7595480.1 cupin domain-containing protein [Pseudomonadales bacterium]HJN52432.1 cupin domain-containing protein [Pseudomonadales bacterium]|tara:strand:+ start:48 stop:578 length:531 start_codon:yes stop_codon:yes gene_type:complete